MTTNGKHPGGRPSKYDPSFVKQVRNLCLLGATDEDLARAFEVDVTTIDEWKIQHSEFSGALKEGKLEADGKVAKSLYQRARGYSHEAVKIFLPANTTEPVYAPYIEHYPPDTTACIFWLKNRRSDVWRDKHEIGLATTVIHEFNFDALDSEQLSALSEILSVAAEEKKPILINGKTNGKGH